MSTRSARWRRRGLYTAAALVLVLLVHIFIVRPWYFRWGATDTEIQKAWPGDRLIANAVKPVTRAITIHAPVASVWPWIAQIGQDRAGFYSYTFLENLFRADMHNADRIIPEFQDRKVGDTVWMASKKRYNGEGRMVVAEYEPNHAMVLVSPADAERIRQGGFASFAWSFVVEPVDANTTRLVMRSIGGAPTTWKARVANLAFWEPAHFIMERKMMLGIRDRAEKTARQPT